MPPLPKKKHTRARKGNRNAHNAMGLPAISSNCPRCQIALQPHRACKQCGYYNNRKLPGNWPVNIDEETSTQE
tara:strand:- start:60233 stop:60451 length:219 start_codon:yes stop_codon:yes gene_type:complete